MKQSVIVTLLVALVMTMSPVVLGQEARVVLRSTVVGNQEQPKVLYIVPWQQAEKPEIIYQPLQSVVDGVFRQIDRDEFLRELDYQQKISQSLQAQQ